MKTISTQIAVVPFVRDTTKKMPTCGLKGEMKRAARRTQRRAVKSWLNRADHLAQVNDEISFERLAHKRTQKLRARPSIRPVEAAVSYRVGVSLEAAMANDHWFNPTVISMPVRTSDGVAYQNVCVAVCC